MHIFSLKRHDRLWLKKCDHCICSSFHFASHLWRMCCWCVYLRIVLLVTICVGRCRAQTGSPDLSWCYHWRHFSKYYCFRDSSCRQPWHFLLGAVWMQLSRLSTLHPLISHYPGQYSWAFPDVFNSAPYQHVSIKILLLIFVSYYH